MKKKSKIISILLTLAFMAMLWPGAALAVGDTTPPEWADVPLVAGDRHPGCKRVSFIPYPKDETVTAYYVIVSHGDTPPTKEQVKGGSDYDSVDVLASGSQNDVRTNGYVINPYTMLPADDTIYDTYVVIEDAAGNVSEPAMIELRTPVKLLADGYPKVGTPQAAGSKQVQILNQANGDSETTYWGGLADAYYVAVANGADKPSEYQIKNGMDSTGSAAIASGNVPIETANTEVPAVITLPADAAEYDIYVVLYKAYNASYIVDIWSEVVGLDVTTPLPALAAPTDLAWDDTTPGTIKAKWDTVPNALRYYVYLYKDGHICLETLETTNERNFISNLEVYGTGTYTFKVEAVGDGTNYGNSQKSAVSPGYNYTAAPDKIDIPAISGVTAPVKGAAPVTAITENEQFTGTVTWAPAITGGKFAAGTVYTATITLTPKTGYTLTGVPADFFTVEGADTVSNDADSDIVTAVFPKTAAASSGGRGGSVTPSVTGVAIKAAPDKVAYTEGDELDLSGLLLTLTYSNGTTKDIALADFADNKITVSPKAGDVLDVDDKEIVITVKGKTVKLPITVEEDTTVIPPPAEEPVLTDIDGHWAKDSIEHLIEMGAISGYPDNTFRPDNPITRAEFATVLVKAMGLPVAGSKVFADTESHWAKEAISTAYAAGIISGYNEQSFGPDDLITREQMAVMVAKAAGLTGAAPELEYTDSQQISAWAREFVARAAAEKLISGYPDNTFRPADNATRAEAVTVISRKW